MYLVNLGLSLPADQIQWSCKLPERLQNLQDFHTLDEEIWDETMHSGLQDMKYQKQTTYSQHLLFWASGLKIPER